MFGRYVRWTWTLRASLRGAGTRFMALGILLHALSMMNSDLGLDAHVRLNAAMDETATGQDLAWGNLRVEDSTQQTPDDPGEYNGYIPPWFASETSVKISAFAGVLGVALLAGAVPKWSIQPGGLTQRQRRWCFSVQSFSSCLVAAV